MLSRLLHIRHHLHSFLLLPSPLSHPTPQLPLSFVRPPHGRALGLRERASAALCPLRAGPRRGSASRRHSARPMPEAG